MEACTVTHALQAIRGHETHGSQIKLQDGVRQASLSTAAEPCREMNEKRMTPSCLNLTQHNQSKSKSSVIPTTRGEV